MAAKGKSGKVPVGTRALIQRINRKLKGEDEAVRATRSWQAAQEHGRFYVLDFNRNTIIESDVDLGELGREVKALQPHEEWIEEGRRVREPRKGGK